MFGKKLKKVNAVKDIRQLRREVDHLKVEVKSLWDLEERKR